MKNYKQTLNLPRTEFPMRANLPAREPQIIKKWNEREIYSKVLERRRGKKPFILHDGPPYSNNHIHLGQALNKILKDIVVKYHSLAGFYSPYIPGWDNHGMPIENEVVKSDPVISELARTYKNLKKTDVKIQIRKKCRNFAGKWVEKQKKDFIRLGVLGDWNNPYLTMDKQYEAEELLIFADLVDRGFIYRSKMPIHWCPTCKTALAMAEIEYADIESPSLWFKMKNKDENYYALVWTTTPWTIVSNVAIALNPNLEYVLVDADGTRYLLASSAVSRNKEILKWQNLQVIKTFKGSELEGVKFLHPFFDRQSPVVLADYVNTEDGTGIVHIAPGHGREDFEAGRKYDLPVISPVDEDGKFTADAPMFEGMTTEQASSRVVEVLKENGHFVHLDSIMHSYPHCWRCKTPLIFRATTQWFLDVDHENLRKTALSVIPNIKWIPSESINRITASITERPDWVLSRQRSWGIPIPAVKCKKCGKTVLNGDIIRKLAEFVSKEGSDAWYTHPVSDFLPEGFACECGSHDFEKEMDILDVWFDSGSSSISVMKSRGIDWPPSVYLEGPDQHRGWFNAALMIAMAEKKRPPYNTVVTHGWVLDEKGYSMHKSLGNVIHPSEIINKYGAEILRLWAAEVDYTEDVRLGDEILDRVIDMYRKIRNTIRFMLGNLSDFEPSRDMLEYDKLLPHDRYVLMQWEQTKRIAKDKFESYEFHGVTHLIYRFIVVNLSSFILDYAKDRLYTWKREGAGRRSVQSVMYQILDELLVVLSPVLSFTSEEAYGFFNKPDKKDSVFLEDWPSDVESRIDDSLARDFEYIMAVRSRVLHVIEVARKDKKIINDRLESFIQIIPKSKEIGKVLLTYKAYLPEIFIVSQVELSSGCSGEYSEEDENAKVCISHAKGEKCERCWMWSEDIKGGLCPKCREVVDHVNKP